MHTAFAYIFLENWRDYFYRSMNIGHNLIHTGNSPLVSPSAELLLPSIFLVIITLVYTTSNESNGFAWNANTKNKPDLYLFNIELHIEWFHSKAGSAQALEVTSWQIIIIQVISKRSSRRKFIVVAARATYKAIPAVAQKKNGNYNIYAYKRCFVRGTLPLGEII